MCSNNGPFDHGQAIAHASTPDPHPPSSPPSAVPSNTGGLAGGLQNGPAVGFSIYAPVNVSLVDLTSADLAAEIATKGIPWGAHVAAQWHSANNPANALTVHELLSRVYNVPASVAQNRLDYHQDLPNAVALRLLASRPGPDYLFTKTTRGTDNNGKPKVIWRCGGCGDLTKDKSRHMAEKHIKDIDTAFCCPYERCCVIYYAGRESEMKVHFKDHEKRIERAQSKGQTPILLSAYTLQ